MGLMERDDCARLVNMIVSTWPAGVKGYVWTDTLGDLDYDDARTVYRSLRDSEERPPSVARFLAAYRAARATTIDQDPWDACGLCQNTGWVPAGPEVELGNPRSYSYVQPCMCSRGQTMVPVHAAIIDTNRQR